MSEARTISSENKKTLREAMSIRSVLIPSDEKSLYPTPLNFKFFRYQASENVAWINAITDFQGDGFLLGDYPQLPNGSNEGIRTHIGAIGDAQIRVSPTETVDYITLYIESGKGEIIFDGETYEVSGRQDVWLSYGSSSAATITVRSSDPERRIVITDISGCLRFDFDNSNIVECNLDLRTDLSLNPSIPISEINMSALCSFPNIDFFRDIANGTKLTFSAGYSVSHSRDRTFYIAEKITIDRNLLTIHAEDAVGRLDSYICQPTGYYDLFYAEDFDNFFYDALTELNIGSILRRISPSGHPLTAMTLSECTLREALADFCNFYFNPEASCERYIYIDAGYPTLGAIELGRNFSSMGGPTIIYTEDVADHKWDYEPEVEFFYSDSDIGLRSEYSPNEDADVYADWINKVKSGGTYTRETSENEIFYRQTIENIYQGPTLVPESFITFSGKKISVKAPLSSYKGSSTYHWYDKNDELHTSNYEDALKFTLYTNTWTRVLTKYLNPHSNKATGRQVELSPKFIGEMFSENETYRVYPRLSELYNKSLKVGSFTWRGDPRLQPGDRIYLVDSERNSELITIEAVTLEFAEGGLTSKVTYRGGGY